MSSVLEHPPRPATHPRGARRGGRLRAALARVPREAWVCALVACLNAVCWSFITPPFQVPDETDHYAYVEQLALTGEPPSSQAHGRYSADQTLTMEALHTNRVRLQPEDPAVFSPAEASELRRALAVSRTIAPRPTGAAGVAAAEPPLYYALELIPYELGSGGTVLDRLELMRLLSALMAGLTALFVFLFVREALPGARWAWIVGGGAIAVTPLLGFMSGAVTPEALLYAVSAATFYLMARAFRRGLTPRRAAAIGVVVAIGLLSKLNFVGLLPGIAIGAIVMVGRLPAPSRARLMRAGAVGLALAAALVAAAYASGAVSHSAFGTPEAAVLSLARHGSPLGRADYIWQFFLPRIPGTVDDFPGIFTTRQIWFDGFVGLYGWLDTTFPGWVYDVALLPAGILAALCLRALATGAGALRARIGELLAYLTMAAGLLILVGSASYTGFPQIGGAYAQSRYLLPLLALMAAALALAVRGAGRRWGPAVGVAVLMLFVAHDLFSQLQVIARYYG